MSQTDDYNIENGSGSTVRADINSVLGAINTNNIGADAPSSLVAGSLWIDNSTTNWLVQFYDGVDSISVIEINTTSNKVKILNNLEGVTSTDLANISQIQDGSFNVLSGISGTNTIIASTTPTLTAYEEGQYFFLKVANTNTGAVTLNVDSVGAIDITVNGANLVASQIKANEIHICYYDGTNFEILTKPQANYVAYINDGGAIPDDSTDSSTAAQTILNSGATLVKGVGDFFLASGISVPTGVTLEIDGQIRVSDDSLTAITLSGAGAKCRGFKVVGAGKTSGTSSVGVQLSSDDNLCEYMEVTGFANTGIGSGSSSTSADIHNNKTYENKTGISVFRTDKFSVLNNDVSFNGLTTTGAGIALTGNASSNTIDGICMGNEVYDNYTNGIKASDANNITITGNNCPDNGSAGSGKGSGIAVTLDTGASCSGFSVNSNICKGNSDHGIVFQNEKNNTDTLTGITAVGNVCEDNQKCGIRLIQNIDLATIVGNTCNSNGADAGSTGFRNGIMLACNVTRNIISSNTCLSNPEEGILVTDLTTDFTNAGSGENTISNNNCRSNGGYGIAVRKVTANSSANRILDNFCRGNGAGEILDEGVNTEKRGNRFTFNAIQGEVVLTAGTATITTGEAQTGSRIELSVKTVGGTQGILSTVITDGVSFTINSTDSSDTSTIYWQINH